MNEQKIFDNNYKQCYIDKSHKVILAIPNQNIFQLYGNLESTNSILYKS